MASLIPSSERLRFRRMELADLGSMERLLGDPRVMAYYPSPKTRADALAWINWNRDNYARDGYGLWIITDEAGTFVGDCGLTWQRVDGEEHLEIGYHVVPEMQGRGLASEGAAACRRLAEQRGVPRLIAIIHPDNVPSQRVAENVGLSFEKSTVDGRGAPIRIYSVDL